ncbi:ATP-binding protein [Embleya sp. NBC_00896]|uniref:ATP-binding protein n=1 Tax=Embleya sp. NBC_00896 TaxID=2975961 RepID=UPI00386A2F84|nr:ATP-binding protein [Embleya sp. NBC_00896]
MPAAETIRGLELTLPCNPVVVPQMRRVLGDLLLAWGLSADHELAYDVRLIATELIANAVEHAGEIASDLTVSLSLGDGWLHFGVRDAHPFRPRALNGTLDEVSGRGLLIVRELAAEARGYTDVEPHPDGKTIRVSLPWPIHT